MPLYVKYLLSKTISQAFEEVKDTDDDDESYVCIKVSVKHLRLSTEIDTLSSGFSNMCPSPIQNSRGLHMKSLMLYHPQHNESH